LDLHGIARKGMFRIQVARRRKNGHTSGAHPEINGVSAWRQIGDSSHAHRLNTAPGLVKQEGNRDPPWVGDPGNEISVP